MSILIILFCGVFIIFSLLDLKNQWDYYERKHGKDEWARIRKMSKEQGGPPDGYCYDWQGNLRKMWEPNAGPPMRKG